MAPARAQSPHDQSQGPDRFGRSADRRTTDEIEMRGRAGHRPGSTSQPRDESPSSYWSQKELRNRWAGSRLYQPRSILARARAIASACWPQRQRQNTLLKLLAGTLQPDRRHHHACRSAARRDLRAAPRVTWTNQLRCGAPLLRRRRCRRLSGSVGASGRPGPSAFFFGRNNSICRSPVCPVESRPDC